MNNQQFQEALKKLKAAPRTKEVLCRLLQKQEDKLIQKEMNYDDEGSVRKVISNIYKAFNIKGDVDGDRKSRRELLITLFEKHNFNWENECNDLVKKEDKPAQTVMEEEIHSGDSNLVKRQIDNNYTNDNLAILPYYIPRLEIESECQQEILRPGAVIEIKAPWKMGKTSLIRRILQQAKDRGYHTVYVDFDQADKEIFSNLDRLLRWLCDRVSKELNKIGVQLRVPSTLKEYWADPDNCKDNFKQYFEDNILAQIKNNLLVGLDNAGLVYREEDRSIAHNFFDIVRYWHEHANFGQGHNEKIRVALTLSRDIYEPNTNRNAPSPFNVGLSIELKEFNESQVIELLKLYQPDIGDTNDVEKLMAMVGGYPFLIHKAIEHIHYHKISISNFLETSPTDNGKIYIYKVYSDHLQKHLSNLQNYPALGSAMKKIVDSTEPIQIDKEEADILYIMGLVTKDKKHKELVEPRCKLYRQYFQDYL